MVVGLIINKERENNIQNLTIKMNESQPLKREWEWAVTRRRRRPLIANLFSILAVGHVSLWALAGFTYMCVFAQYIIINRLTLLQRAAAFNSFCNILEIYVEFILHCYANFSLLSLSQRAIHVWRCIKYLLMTIEHCCVDYVHKFYKFPPCTLAEISLCLMCC